MAQPFDAEHLKPTGEVFPIAEHVGVSANVSNGAFSVSENGVLVFGAGGALVDQQLAWVDRAGKRLGVVGKPGRAGSDSLSPNGKRVAFVLAPPSGPGADIWLYDLERDTATRFTFGRGLSVAPLWSPDGSRIVYASSATTLARFDIYQKPSSGAGKEELLSRGGTNLSIWDWSRDGKWVVYSPEPNAKTKADLWLLPMEGDHKPVPYLETPFNETLAQFSPDGRWMAYASDESGQEQVYVQPIPANGAKWQVSTSGGSRPRWSHDGRELFYTSADQKLMAVPVKIAGISSGDFQAGAPQPLFDFTATPTAFGFGYQPSADGHRFLVRTPAEGGTGPPPLTVVLHWEAGLKK